MDFFIKNPIVVFFRDVISGWWYVLYIFACIFMIFVFFGVVGDRKRRAIEEKLKEKKKWAIESGEEARRAAMESKQVLDVMEDAQVSADDAVVDESNDLTKKDEAPSILVIDADGSSNSSDEKTS